MSKKLIAKILTQTATTDEKEQFSQWLNQSTINKLYFDQAKIIWDKLDGIYSKEKFDIDAANKKIQLKAEKLISRSNKFKWRKRIAVAASIAFVIGISLFIYNQSFNQSYKVFTSGDAIEQIILDDGTQIWLNKNSTIKLPDNFSLSKRKVYLKGEAYFEVARNEAKPFKVFSGKTITRVLGTSFNINENTLIGDVKLDVITGKVMFIKLGWRNESGFLMAGEQAQYSKAENLIVIHPQTDLNFLSWKTGELKFYETPLDQVCNDLSRHFKLLIYSRIDNCDLALTGNFKNEDLEKILKSIELTLDVEISKHNNEIVIENYTINP